MFLTLLFSLMSVAHAEPYKSVSITCESDPTETCKTLIRASFQIGAADLQGRYEITAKSFPYHEISCPGFNLQSGGGLGPQEAAEATGKLVIMPMGPGIEPFIRAIAIYTFKPERKGLIELLYASTVPAGIPAPVGGRMPGLPPISEASSYQSLYQSSLLLKNTFSSNMKCKAKLN